MLVDRFYQSELYERELHFTRLLLSLSTLIISAPQVPLSLTFPSPSPSYSPLIHLSIGLVTQTSFMDPHVYLLYFIITERSPFYSVVFKKLLSTSEKTLLIIGATRFFSLPYHYWLWIPSVRDIYRTWKIFMMF